MDYDEWHWTQSLLKIDIPVFIKLIWRYTSIILCRINFGIIFLTLTCNASCKRTRKRYFRQKHGGNQKLLYFLHWKQWTVEYLIKYNSFTLVCRHNTYNTVYFKKKWFSTCKLTNVIASWMGFVHTRSYLDLIISASSYYFI